MTGSEDSASDSCLFGLLSTSYSYTQLETLYSQSYPFPDGGYFVEVKDKQILPVVDIDLSKCVFAETGGGTSQTDKFSIRAISE